MNRAEVLAAYTEQVRKSTAPDGTGAGFEFAGPVLRRLGMPGQGGSGVFWTDLDGHDADAVIAAQIAFFAARGEEFEWKHFSYDHPADLAERLVAAGLTPDEPESLMVAEAEQVVDAMPGAVAPDGVRLERVTSEEGVDRLIQVSERVFGEDRRELRASLLTQLATAPETTEMVVAMAGDEPVSSARMDLLPGSSFSGLWGGGTLPQWRRRGLYRALVRYRAELALGRGYRYLTVDASDQSRPILEHIGFECLAITTPYLWEPPG
jgi:GNAT superfamily N-acetyltransferase